MFDFRIQGNSGEVRLMKVSDFVTKEIGKFQHAVCMEFAVHEKGGRRMTLCWYQKKLAGGKGATVERKWLAHSPSKKSAYCAPCVLFPHTPS